MPSLFYKATFERRFPLPFLFLEDLGIAVKALGQEPTEEQVADAIKSSLKRSLPDIKPRSEDIAYVSERLEKLAAQDKGEEGDSKKKQDFASSFTNWAGKLEPHEVCLVAADMDYFQARRLYAEVDRDDVVDLSTQWVKREWERVKVGYESVVYGFGGGYKDNGVTGTEVDVSVDQPNEGKVINPAALAAVKF